jgi:hypothetical protein
VRKAGGWGCDRERRKKERWMKNEKYCKTGKYN